MITVKYPCRRIDPLITCPAVWVLGSILFGVSLAQGQLIAWKDGAQNLGTMSGSPTLPVMASTGLRTVAVWGTGHIWVTGQGVNDPLWLKPQQLDDGKGASKLGQVGIAGERVVAVWLQTLDGTQRVMAKGSADGGATWQGAQSVGVVTGRVDFPRLVMAGTTAVAGWLQEVDGRKQIMCSRSSDGGTTWTAGQSVVEGLVRDLTLAASGNRVVAVWTEDDETGGSLISNFSTDGGIHWGKPQPVEQSASRVYGGVFWGYWPQITMDGSKVAVAWCQERDGVGSLFVGSSSDGGATWGTAQLLESGKGEVAYPRIAFSGETAVAAWMQDNGIASAVYSVWSTNSGKDWSAPRMVSVGEKTADNPELAVQGKQAVLIWRQYVSSGNSVLASRSLDGGVTWQEPQLLETQDTMAWYPNVVIMGGRAAALWQQYVPDTYGIFGSGCTIEEGIWQGSRIIASGHGDAWDPVSAIDGNRLLAVWPCYQGDEWTVQAIASKNNGESWVSVPSLGAGTGQVGAVTVALDRERAVALWRQNEGAAGWALNAVSSADCGFTWNGPVRLAGGELSMPAVAVAGKTVVAVWRVSDGAAGDRLVVARSEDGGAMWLPAVPLETGGAIMDPQVAISGKQVLVTWTRGEDGGSSIRAIASVDGGVKWGAVITLQKAVTNAGQARIGLAGSRVVVAWQQRDGCINRIYANGSDDAGRTWRGAVPVETGFGNAWGPLVSFVDDKVLVVWRQRQEKQDVLYGAISGDAGKTWGTAQRIVDSFGDAPVAPVGAVAYTQVMSFQRVANAAPPQLMIRDSRAMAVQVIREPKFWMLLYNSGSIGISKEVGQ